VKGPAAPGLRCANCGGAMRALELAGHYGRPVEIDVCEPCHLVWFDTVESARLAGPGLLDLVSTMAGAQALAHQPLRPALACTRCREPLKPVHNLTRWGRSMQLECPQRHGSAQTFAMFLAEKGLVRPLGSADRARLAASGELPCLNCGAPLATGDAECRWCGSVPSLIDVARLARALDPEGATEAHAVHRQAAARGVLGCMACGAALPSHELLACPHCAATLATPRLADAAAQVQSLGPALREHAERPAAHVVQRRLARLAEDAERRREWAAEMQAEADARAGAARGDDAAGGLAGRPWTARSGRSVVLLLALLAWLWWWFGG
jgi:hypothetical protein